MNTCDLIIEWLDDYLDGTLSEDHRATFEAHLKSCDACQSLVLDLQSMKEVLSDMPLMALPTDFNETLHEKLIIAAEELKQSSGNSEKANSSKKKSNLVAFPVKKWMPYAGLAAAFAIFIGAGSQLQNAFWWNQSTEEAAYDLASTMDRSMPQANANVAGAAAPEVATFGVASDGASAKTAESAPVSPTTDQSMSTYTDVSANRDLIRTGDISLKVGSIEQFTHEIQALIEAAGGYIESSFSAVSPYYVNNKEAGSQLGASIVLRVPSEQFIAVFDGVKKMGELTSSQQGVQDITAQLSDLKASLANLEVREKRLQALMNEAKNVTEVMAVERELSAVRTQIDQISGQLKLQTQQVSLSTLYISVQESPEIANQFKTLDGNLWQQAVSALIGNVNKAMILLERLFILVVAWFPAAIGALLVFLGLKQTKTYKKWRTKK